MLRTIISALSIVFPLASGTPVEVTKVTTAVACPSCGPDTSWRSTKAGWACTACGALAPPSRPPR